MKLKITIDGKPYEVEVEVEQTDNRPILGGGSMTMLSSPSGEGAPGKDGADEGHGVKSPLAGVVSNIEVSVGDKVEKDAPLLVLEAMKMFTTITAPVAATIKSIPVAKGEQVAQGRLLVEFE
jgi:methylmalonyl-CoA carboxyltransferase small subunit